MIHHRTPEFSREFAELLRLLGPVFGTTGVVLPVHTTGRGAMEAAICNLFSSGDEIAVCCNGKFGEMWAGFAESYGLGVRRISTDWSRDVSVRDVEECMGAHPALRAVALTYGDTSTGVRNDIEAVCRAARSRDVLVMVDGVSSFGGMPFAFDHWGVDVAITASQKCLMSSPGLAFVALSDRAWTAVRTARLPRNYWDFAQIRSEVTKPKPETPGTPPVHIVLQVAEALRMMSEEGLPNVFRRHEELAARTRRGAAELGLTMQCPSLTQFAATLTVITLPPGVRPKTVRDVIKARGILTAAGLARFADTAIRIGHMGDIRMADVERTLVALGEALAEAREA
jgi:aspartate aminotransferase-like enzyme